MANDAQIDYWNVTAGPEWVRRQAFFDTMLEPFGAAALQAADPVPGQRFLDVGCGCGTTTLELARRLTPGGRVVGVDVSAPMLDVTRRRAAEAGLGEVVEVLEADAQTHAFPPGRVDAVFSRMGVMFFEDPEAAFANLGHAVGPGGRMVFTCWQALAANEWMSVPLAALRSIVTLPAPLPPGSPGPFAYGDQQYLRSVLDGAGWTAIEIEPQRERLVLGGDDGLAGAVGHIAELNVTRTALADVDETTRTRALAAVRVALERHVDPRGHVRIEGAAWLVRAQRTG